MAPSIYDWERIYNVQHNAITMTGTRYTKAKIMIKSKTISGVHVQH